MVDKYLKSNICPLPWTSIETRPDGTFQPCCVYKYNIRDEKGKKLNTRTHTVSEAQNSKDMKDLRKEFLEGKRPEGCEACWKEEDSGKTSKRQHLFLKSPLFSQHNVQKGVVAPHFIDLKLGNICNLKCRICSPHSSSQWVPDYIKIDPENKANWQEYNKKGMWPREKSRFLEDADNWIPHVRFFEITGGEPLMIQEQFDILQKCIDMGVAKNIQVHYNTNGTHFPEHAMKNIWPHFKRVELAFSIDDVGERFEYQRKNANWEEVNSNISKFVESGLQNLELQVCTTINFFNILYLADLAKQVKLWNPHYWYINILHWPVEFDIQQLDKEIKDAITERLSSGDLYKKEIDTAIAYLNQEPKQRVPNIDNLRKFKIRQIDKLRNENFKETFTDLNMLQKIYD